MNANFSAMLQCYRISDDVIYMPKMPIPYLVVCYNVTIFQMMSCMPKIPIPYLVLGYSVTDDVMYAQNAHSLFSAMLQCY